MRARVLGRAVSLEMAAEGSYVAMLDINPMTLGVVASEIKDAGGHAKAYELDITDYDAYREVVDDVIETHGKIDVLVNNAAISPSYETILNDTLDDWRRTISTNLEAVYMGSKLVAPHMVERKDGRIISNRVGPGVCRQRRRRRL